MKYTITKQKTSCLFCAITVILLVIIEFSIIFSFTHEPTSADDLDVFNLSSLELPSKGKPEFDSSSKKIIGDNDFWESVLKTASENTANVTRPVLAMTVNGSGNIIPPEGSYVYDLGSNISISATPNIGWEFTYWNGEVSDNFSANTTVTMDTDKTVTANFKWSSGAEWSHIYDTKQGNAGNSICQTDDGGYIITGYKMHNYRDYYLPYYVFLVKTDSSGNLTWSKTFSEGQGHSVCQTSDGGFIITCTKHKYGLTGFKSINSNIGLIKTDNSGNLIWSRTYEGNLIDKGYSVRETNEGGYIIIVVYRTTASYDDALLMKTDSKGDVIWRKRYGGEGNDIANYICPTDDGGYAITGQNQINTPGGYTLDTWLIKTDSNGNDLINKTYHSGSVSASCGYCVQQTIDGGYIITGSLYDIDSSPDHDVWLIKTDSSGDVTWNKVFGGTGDEYGYSVCQTNDGGYLVISHTNSTAGHVWLIKTDAAGNKEWDIIYEDNLGYVSSACKTMDGGYVVVGYYSGEDENFSDPITERDLWILKFQTKTLTIGTNIDGNISLSPGIHEYLLAATISITATPLAGWRFVNWAGDVDTISDVNSANTTITMNDNYAIYANFARIQQSDGDGGDDGSSDDTSVTVVEAPTAEPPAPSPAPTPASSPVEKPVTPTQLEKEPEISVPAQIVKPEQTPGNAWWLIVIYVFAGVIIVSLGTYFFIRRRSTVG